MFSLRTASSFTSRNIASAPPASTFMSIHYWGASAPSQENARPPLRKKQAAAQSCPWASSRTVRRPRLLSFLLVPKILSGWYAYYVPDSQTEDHQARRRSQNREVSFRRPARKGRNRSA